MFGYTTIENLKKEFGEMRGKEVGYGYFRHTESDIKDNEIGLDILDLLEELSCFEITNGVAWDDEEECEMEMHISDYIAEGLENGWIEEVNCGNSYNWCSYLNHEINYTIYKDFEKDVFYVELKVHRYGDVRCNYSDNVYLEFNHEDDFFEALMEVCKYIEVEIDDKLYVLSINALSDNVELEVFENEEWDNIWNSDEKYEILNKMEKLDLIIW